MKPVKTFRDRDSSLIYGVCAHGYDHPLWASLDWMKGVGTYEEGMDFHFCDGCCEDHEWIVSTLQESVHISHEYIRSYQKELVRLRERQEFFEGR